MALIPEQPRQQYALVAIILALGLGYAFYTYWYTPATEELGETQDRIDRLETSNRQAQIIAARGGEDLEANNALLQDFVRDLETLIPAFGEVPALLREINEQARRAGVTISEIQPAPDEQTQFYVRQTWSMDAVGEYHDVGRFLTAIASLPRIIVPVDMNVSVIQSAQGLFDQYESPVIASFSIEHYVLPDPQAAPTAAPAGG